MRGHWSGVLTGLGSALLFCISPLVANGATSSNFAPDRSDPIALRCDRAMDRAAAAQQPGKTALEAIDPAQSLADCRAAALRQPPRVRYQYLYAAALLAAKRYPEAAAQLIAADAAGYAPAAVTLGDLYYNGVGVPRNPQRAQQLWLRAGAEGDPGGYIQQGIASLAVNPPNYSAARVSLESASRMGSVEADTRLGAMYLYGVGGRGNEARGVALLQKSTDAGDSEAELTLGNAYLEGAGVARDPSKGTQLLRRSASGGNLQADDILGYIYYNGDGVPQDRTAGLAWFAQAAAKNDPMAMTYLGDALVEQGNTTDGLPWLEKAANLNYPPAERTLGAVYAGDKGIATDPAKAFYWHKRAADHGDALGKFMLGQDYAYGVGVSPDTTVARKLYLDAQRDPDAAPYVAQELARLDARPGQARQSAPAAPAPAVAPTGNYWPDIPDDPFGGDGGIIKPVGTDTAPSQPAAPPAVSNRAAQPVAPPAASNRAARTPSPPANPANARAHELTPGQIAAIGFGALVLGSVLFRSSTPRSGGDFRSDDPDAMWQRQFRCQVDGGRWEPVPGDPNRWQCFNK